MVKLNSEFIDNLMIEELIKKIERLPARIEGNMQAWEPNFATSQIYP